MPLSTPQYNSVQDPEIDLCALFPHRHDYLWAEHPAPGERPQWQTQSKHPLSDRLIQQGAFLYGVRFGAKTNYFVIDIDKSSAYHPSRDPFAIQRLLAALEGIGIVAYLAVTSSQSGGLHLYFPYKAAQKSYQIGRVVQAMTQNAGFRVKPGHLEIFPNARPYQEKLSLYAGHRLPLQLGSYLLNQNFEPIFTTEAEFIRQWKFAQARNDLSTETIEQAWRTARRQERAITKNAAKFLNDLDAEIEPGWTGFGQTNWILSKVADREFIFRHVVSGGEPLQGETLVAAILCVVTALPGYKEFCRHQHDIEERVRDWARCVENHRYHYGGTKAKLMGNSSPQSKPPNQNVLKAENAQRRICEAVADLIAKSELPSAITARRKAIERYGISPTTLNKYRSLWHPAERDHTLEKQEENDPVEKMLEPSPNQEVRTLPLNKLLDAPAASSKQAGILELRGGFGGSFLPPELKQEIEAAIGQGRRQQAEIPSKVTLLNAKRQKRAEAQRQAQLCLWLASGDHILIKEARDQLGLPERSD
ncbi:MAG: hypothetical protein KME13_26165 [Myxacorys californica WJT36-NPBG1]|jgi:hypothetical protein|nr:hypothetical protein [Myxacorys californica WJT36-NPBG1]